MPLQIIRLSALVLAFSMPPSDGQEDKGPELIPAPKEAQTVSSPPVLLVEPPPTAFYRTNRYDVWQAYEVDRRGAFRPRVIMSPSGAYYYRDGKPFYWTTTRPEIWKPVIVN